jgi:hypothetical protein
MDAAGCQSFASARVCDQPEGLGRVPLQHNADVDLEAFRVAAPVNSVAREHHRHPLRRHRAPLARRLPAGQRRRLVRGGHR